MVTIAELRRRLATRVTHRLDSLPILVLSVHSACNCRCVMCDIWKANADKREISVEELERHLDAIRALHVQRVMLTGGEPLLHGNLWKLCDRLHELGIEVTLVTTGLLISQHVDDIATSVDELVISLDGAADVHDDIRRVRGGFERVARGIGLLNNYASRPRTIARCVVQRRNHAYLVQSIEAIRGTGVDRLSFLAADVGSTAFNRPQPWDADRRAEVALSADQLPLLAAAIRDVENRCGEALRANFVVGGTVALWRIHDYFAALAGLAAFPPVRCNAPWVSAVLEPGGTLRPCFFHPPYQNDRGAGAFGEPLLLNQALNTPSAIAFRRALDIDRDDTCQRCVCTLSLPLWRDA
jgi:MoaA/NifB/PqqE/SkfB family radical SAM enzyme